MIVGFTGFARTGKDTAAVALTESGQGHRFALADPLKETAFKALASLTSAEQTRQRFSTPADKEVLRPFLVALGATARAIDPDVWIKLLDNSIQSHAFTAGQYPVVTDIRYANEAKWLLSQPHPLLIYMDRPGFGPANDEEQRSFDEIFACSEVWNNKNMVILRNDGDIDKLHVRIRECVDSKLALGL